MSAAPAMSQRTPVQNDARARLVEDHLALARGIARRYAHRFAGRGLDEEDLAQEGVIGLLRAAEEFDASYGVPFRAYARYWVRQAIVQAIQTRAALWQLHGREPDLCDLAEACGISRVQAAFLFAIGQEVASLDAPLGDAADGDTLRDTLAAPDDGEEQACQSDPDEKIRCTI